MSTRTLTFTPAATVTREAMTRTTAVGPPGFFHAYNLNSRPFYQFTLELGPLVKSEAECLSALHAFHQGIKFFLYNGGHYGRVDDYVLAGIGDGGRKDFFIPNRHIGPNSIAMQTYRPSTGASSTWTSNFSLFAGPGVLFTSSAVRSGDEVRVKYGCEYLCNFAPGGIALEQIATDLYTANLVIRENPDPIAPVVSEVTTQVTATDVTLAAVMRTAANMTAHAPRQLRTLTAQTILGANIATVVTVASGGAGRLAVSSGDTAATINTGLPNSSGLTMAPEWNTTWWVTSKGTSTVNVGFGTQVVSGGSFINYGTFSL